MAGGFAETTRATEQALRAIQQTSGLVAGQRTTEAVLRAFDEASGFSETTRAAQRALRAIQQTSGLVASARAAEAALRTFDEAGGAAAVLQEALASEEQVPPTEVEPAAPTGPATSALQHLIAHLLVLFSELANELAPDAGPMPIMRVLAMLITLNEIVVLMRQDPPA
jgi:hypothetical protein